MSRYNFTRPELKLDIDIPSGNVFAEFFFRPSRLCVRHNSVISPWLKFSRARNRPQSRTKRIFIPSRPLPTCLFPPSSSSSPALLPEQRRCELWQTFCRNRPSIRYFGHVCQSVRRALAATRSGEEGGGGEKREKKGEEKKKN